ncbi:MAG TPA: hypothetical protein VHA82_11655 [Ramlibacter sp.]|nr:hypothetical protein [Ramlibacter sp.]
MASLLLVAVAKATGATRGIAGLSDRRVLLRALLDGIGSPT